MTISGVEGKTGGPPTIDPDKRKHRRRHHEGHQPEPGPKPGDLANFQAPPQITSASTTAPVMPEEEATSFFSSGSGSAQMYSFSEAGGVGQEEQGETTEGSQ